MSKARNISKLTPDSTGALPGTNIADSAITTEKIAPDTVVAADIAPGAVGSSELATGAAVANIGFTPLNPANNLSEVTAATARTNLGVTATGADTTYAYRANNLSDLASASTARTNLGLGTLATVSPTGTADSTKFLRGDNSWQIVAVTPTAVSDQNNTSTGYFDLPAGTTAQRPGSPAAGFARYNTDISSVEFYNGSTWVGTNIIPVVNSVTGTLYVGSASTLTVNITNATATVDIRFIKSGSVLAETQNVSVSGGNASVAVPAAVYNSVSAGDTVSIFVINSDGTQSSNSASTTAIALPTGGTITTSGGYRYHTFTGSGTFTTFSGYTPTVDLLVVAGGGGGGGSGNGKGGGGAGGCVQQTVATSATAYTITIGGGGGAGAQGSSSSALGYTATGGGYGASYNATGGSGGSGGGSPRDGSSYSPGSGTAGQGYAGGTSPSAGCSSAGGGGGAAMVGYTGKGDCGAAMTTTASAGGDGINWKSLGTYYGGGGGGAYEGASRGTYGGLGGGGIGGSSITTTINPTSGTANTGGGGGGGQGQTSGSGGSGIVIIRYAV